MIQPLFYKNAVQIHPAVAVIAVLAGAQLAGILGALLAIPVAASLGVIFDEIWPPPEDDQEPPRPPCRSRLRPSGRRRLGAAAAG